MLVGCRGNNHLWDMVCRKWDMVRAWGAGGEEGTRRGQDSWVPSTQAR